MAGFGGGKFGSGAFGSAEDAQIGEVVSISEELRVDDLVPLAETVGIVEDLDVQESIALREDVSIFDLVRTGAFAVGNIGGNVVRVTFATELHHDGLGDGINFLLEPASRLEAPGAPVLITGLQPLVDVLQEGSDGIVVPEAGRLDAVSRQFRFGGTLDPLLNQGDFLRIKNGQNVGVYQIIEVIEAGPEALVILDKTMVLAEGTDVEWEHTTGVTGIDISTSKLKNGGAYAFAAKNLYQKWPKFPVALASDFRAQGVELPHVVSASAGPEGHVTVVFSEAMQQDAENLGNPGDYTILDQITGLPGAVVKSVYSVDDRRVVLTTSGLVLREYTLRVSTNTPQDLAGNPVDPDSNSYVFLGLPPILTRSVFTDKGPIAKPPLTLQAGTAGAFASSQVITLPEANLAANHVGRTLRLSGSDNDGDYEIAAVLSATQARVKTRFNLPDDSDGAVNWELIDPRTGEIADHPNDVVVRVNGNPVTPIAVNGLRGQIVLLTAPAQSAVVDYYWFNNPRVEVRRLNSLEFRLNAWNRDHGGYTASNRHYRFNNVLVTPSNYHPIPVGDGYEMLDIRAALEQPLLRQVKYRAYERAYTALLNDPARLLFNTPIHRVAFPPAQRVLEEEAVFYEGTSLPEVGPSPWVRKGSGTAMVGAGSLVVVDNSAGTFPAGSPLFWTRRIDLTFDHVFSVAWRFSVNAVTTTEGVWTGLAAGYTNERVGYVLGYLLDGGVRKIGFLRRGALDAVASASAWTGGVDGDGAPTNAPVALDWAVLHSYRMFTDGDGVVRLFIDGSVVETLRIVPGDTPFLEELNAPFDEIQGVFFGSLSRPATSTSTWDFYRYIVQPINALQTARSSLVSYEANALPEVDLSPWTPIGFHGIASAAAGVLTLAATSATDSATSAAAGLVGGDFHGYVKIEPLLSAASQIAVDARLQLLTLTHGIDPDGLMLAVDDGTRLMQLCFFAASASPRLSYGGRSLPENYSPFFWSALGGQTAAMRGRVLRLSDASTTDGRVYFVEDTASPGSPARAIDAAADYMLEVRLAVVSYTVDGSGYAGAFAQVFDGTRSVGIMLREVAGVRYVAFHSDGAELSSASFAFDWADGVAHTYRVRKATAGSLVSLFVDGALLGTYSYNDFVSTAPDVVGILSFGSSTPASDAARSVVDWWYCNAWRVEVSPRRYMGLWKGRDRDSLTGYHLPVKAKGTATAIGNVLRDLSADFDAAGVAAGDPIVVDDGPNKGVYAVQTVASTELTITRLWPAQPTVVAYRVARETDWSEMHSYRLARDSTGTVTVTIDADVETPPSIRVDYDSTVLPTSDAGVVHILSGGLPAVVFGCFSAEHLGQSQWDHLRYAITRDVSGLSIVPPHQVLNQWNVMESPERLSAAVPVAMTSFKSSSTGSTSQTDPDFLARADVAAHTQLNQGTPPMPRTQTSEVRGLPIPADVLYTSLQLVETTTGAVDLIAPLGDLPGPSYGGVEYQREVCLSYDAADLPEDTASPTPWVLTSDDPDEVVASVSRGILTYGTSDVGTRTAYLNNTPLPDAPSLQTEATFRLRLLEDATLGVGDSQVRFGLSAPGMTLAIGFKTHPNGERFVEIYDLNNDAVLGRATVDYLDGEYHDYRIVRRPSDGLVEVFIDEA